MPLDGSNTNLPAPDLKNYSLEGLAWILRNGNDGHEWHFAESCKCAIRTAQARWGRDLTVYDLAFGDASAATRIFLTGGYLNVVVTPEIVAGRIDDFRAGRPIRVFVEGDGELIDA